MLNPIEEAKFAELKAMCRELKVPAPPEIMIGLKVHDKNGALIFDDVQRGHSWNRNYWNYLFKIMAFGQCTDASFGAGYLSQKDTGAAMVDYPTFGGIYMAQGIINNSTYGILIGTGDTAESVEGYTMAAVIGSGNGAGQMAYSAEATPVTAYTAGSKTWKTTLSRIYNNNSGGSITVKETGMAGLNVNSGGQRWMYERSVLSPTVPVVNGAQLTVTYEISMDFSAID